MATFEWLVGIFFGVWTGGALATGRFLIWNSVDRNKVETIARRSSPRGYWLMVCVTGTLSLFAVCRAVFNSN